MSTQIFLGYPPPKIKEWINNNVILPPEDMYDPLKVKVIGSDDWHDLKYQEGGLEIDKEYFATDGTLIKTNLPLLFSEENYEEPLDQNTSNIVALSASENCWFKCTEDNSNAFIQNTNCGYQQQCLTALYLDNIYEVDKPIFNYYWGFCGIEELSLPNLVKVNARDIFRKVNIHKLNLNSMKLSDLKHEYHFAENPLYLETIELRANTLQEFQEFYPGVNGIDRLFASSGNITVYLKDCTVVVNSGEIISIF